jgi:peptidoglycan L-alanyl-D-glutamate endopeptidase CwlK
MPEFGEKSKRLLADCDPRLQYIFNEVVRLVDCTIITGHRPEHEQNEAYRTGASKAKWPDSKHNTLPSKAIDAIPFPVEWPEEKMGKDEYARALGRFYMFVGYVRAVAAQRGIKIRCGADWDGDFQVKDQNFHDLPHFELVD